MSKQYSDNVKYIYCTSDLQYFLFFNLFSFVYPIQF